MGATGQTFHLRIKVGAQGVEKIDLVDRKLGRLERSAQKTARSSGRLSRALSALPPQMRLLLSTTTAVVTVIASLGTALVAAVRTHMQFERAMSNVASVAGASRQELKRLSDAAREQARVSVFSAREVAQAQYYLASAGMRVNEIIDAQRGVLALAAATQSDLASTSEAVAAALSQFGLDAKDATRVANVYAAAISGSQATLQKLADSMRYVGPIAAQLGQDIETTTAQLMALYNAGLRGEQAGTGLRMAMLRLQNPTKQAAETLHALGVKITDAQGRTRPFLAVMADLHKAGMTAADASRIFGSETATAAMIIAKAVDDIRRYRDEITGTKRATEMATEQTDNLWGAFKQLGSQIEELALTIGERVNPVLRPMVIMFGEMVGHLADFIRGYKQLPGNQDALDRELNKLLEKKKAMESVPLLTKGGVGEAIKAALDVLPGARLLAGWMIPTNKKLKEVNDRIKELLDLKQAMKRASAEGPEFFLTPSRAQLRALRRADADLNRVRRTTTRTGRATKKARDELDDYIDELRFMEKLNGPDEWALSFADMKKQLEDGTKQVREHKAAVEEVNRGPLQEMIERWGDVGRNMQEATINALRSVQGAFGDFFEGLFNRGVDAFGDLWNAFKAIAIQALAQVASVMTMSLFSRGLSWAGVGGITNAAGSAASTGSSFLRMPTSLVGLGDTSSSIWMTPSSQAADWAAINAEISGQSGAGGLFGSGYGAGWFGVAGAAGGIGGSLLAGALFNNKGYSKLGGGLAGAGGAMLGLAIGGPIGAVGLGLLGSLAGGAIGSLFGDDSKQREALEAFENFKSDLQRVRESGQMSWQDYAGLVRNYHTSDNRARQVISSEDLRQLAVQSGVWYAPDAYQVSGAGGELGKGYWMAQTLGGQLGEWAAKLPDNEGLVAFGDALDDIGQKMGPWSAALQDALEGLDLANMSSEELADTLENKLNPATVIQAQLQKDLADGMSHLDAQKKALNTTIDALLGTTDLEAQQEQDLIDLLMRQSGSVADLTAKYNRYQEIQRKLQEAHKLSREEVQRLVDEGRRLRGELGLQQVSWNDVNSSISKLVDEIGKLVSELKKIPSHITTTVETRYVGTRPGSHHTGGLITMHTGGVVEQALLAGLITHHGGMSRMHTGGLAADEVLRILQLGEYVVRRDSVTPATLPLLERINREGEVPLVTVPVSAPESRDSARPRSVFAPVFNFHVDGDVVGDKGVLKRISDDVTKAVRDGLLEASRNGQVVVYAAGVAEEDWNHA